ncbi:ABC transporter ATP-binding protein [Microscilla marina]|uniref:ABC transporter ATP-binding protein n=1 Tax=Microscilla marina ATCC 23134 TaxID=313606 RepID=A1ZQW4_MICM2|nr:ABC transporter ATP-binding protein [Microscilla marina]EAY27269.1 ABC transporter ATP-binding protein [Microscilla marina ATCC 23134]
MFAIQEVIHKYGDKTVLQAPNWSAAQGEQWLLLGNSGSGKTTLLHILGGLLRPTSGQVQMAGQSLQTLQGSQLDKFRAKNIGLVFQKPHLIQTLTVLDNLLLAQYLAGVKQSKARCMDVLEQLGMQTHKKSYPNKLSQGEMQRVSVARAVLNAPKVLLADEPTASLDDHNTVQVINLLKQQAQAVNATLVIATHDQRVKTEISQVYEL